jgi:hypothetical protein
MSGSLLLGASAAGITGSGVVNGVPLGKEAAGHFEAVHSRKAALAKGIALFNANPLKGLR